MHVHVHVHAHVHVHHGHPLSTHFALALAQVIIDFHASGMAYKVDPEAVVGTLVNILVLLAVVTFITDTVVFNLPNGMGLVLSTKRSERTNVEAAFAELDCGGVTHVGPGRLQAYPSDAAYAREIRQSSAGTYTWIWSLICPSKWGNSVSYSLIQLHLLETTH